MSLINVNDIYINQAVQHLLKSKQLIESAPCAIFNGDAIEVHEMKEILDAEAILYKIEPDYPYD